MSDSWKSTAALLALAIPFTFAPTQTFAQQAEASVLDEVIVTARRVSENLQDTPIAITAFSGESLEERQIFQHRCARPGRAEPAVLQQRAARRQQLLLAGLHPRHRPDGSDLHGGSRRRPLHRRCVHRQRRRRHHGFARHRQRAGAARTAGHAVRPQYDRRRDPAHDHRAGRRVRRHGARRRRLRQPRSMSSSRWTCRSATPSSRAFSFGLRKQDGYVERTDGTDLGDTDTWTATGEVRLDAERQLTRHASMSITPRPTRTARRWCSRTINETQTFPRVAQFRRRAAPAWPTSRSRCRPRRIRTTRCANDLQDAGPFHNNGTFPLESTLETGAPR